MRSFSNRRGGRDLLEEHKPKHRRLMILIHLQQCSLAAHIVGHAKLKELFDDVLRAMVLLDDAVGIKQNHITCATERKMVDITFFLPMGIFDTHTIKQSYYS